MKNKIISYILILCLILSTCFVITEPALAVRNYDLTSFSRDAKIMYNAIIRSNYSTLPFAEYSHAYMLAIGKNSSSDVKMEDAYYKTLGNLLKGRGNTHLESSYDDVKNIISAVVPLGSYGVIGYDNITNKTFSADMQDIEILVQIYDNTNDDNLKRAIVHLLNSDYSNTIETIAEFAKAILEDGSEKLPGLYLGKEAMKSVSKLFNIYSLYKTSKEYKTSYADRIYALQGIKQAIWKMYGNIVGNGYKNNGNFTEAELLFANKCYSMLWYCTSEQHLWASSLIGPGKWWNDEKMQKQDHELNNLFSPAYYPYFYSSKLTVEEVIKNCDKITNLPGKLPGDSGTGTSSDEKKIDKPIDSKPKLNVINTVEDKYIVTIPANYTLNCFRNPADTVRYTYISAKADPYNLICTKRLNMSDGSTRYFFISGDNKECYFIYTNSMSMYQQKESIDYSQKPSLSYPEELYFSYGGGEKIEYNSNGKISKVTYYDSKGVYVGYSVFERAIDYFKFTRTDYWYKNGKLDYYVVNELDKNGNNIIAYFYHPDGTLFDTI